MKKLLMSTLLSVSLLSGQAFAGPSGNNDRVITGIIVGATAAALIAAIANADEVKVYPNHQPKHHIRPTYKPQYHHRHKHWQRRDRDHWHQGRFDRREWRKH